MPHDREGMKLVLAHPRHAYVHVSCATVLKARRVLPRDLDCVSESMKVERWYAIHSEVVAVQPVCSIDAHSDAHDDANVPRRSVEADDNAPNHAEIMQALAHFEAEASFQSCLLYTSDAADE